MTTHNYVERGDCVKYTNVALVELHDALIALETI